MQYRLQLQPSWTETQVLLPYLRHDKKAASGEICIVLADEAGAFRMEKETPEEILRRWEGAET